VKNLKEFSTVSQLKKVEPVKGLLEGLCLQSFRELPAIGS